MIPDDVRRFVLTSIPSIPYLELALLFRRDRAATWSPAAVAKVLYISEANAAELLVALAGAGIIAPQAGVENGYVYAPRGPELDDALARLDECYRRDIIGITELVHDTTQRSAHRFAEAFKLRKDK
jgi:hypothetical protein